MGRAPIEEQRRTPIRRRRRGAIAAFAGLLLTAAAAGDEGGAAKSAGGGPAAAGPVPAFLSKHCLGCHDDENEKGGLTLERYGSGAVIDAAAIARDREVWEKVREMLAKREMPPAKRPQPSDAERQAVVDWIAAEAARFDCGSGIVDPGKVTIRRLNRREYQNSVRDLLGIDYAAAADFPTDEVGYGFDTIGDVLSLSPLLLEKYLDAAEDIVGLALERERRLFPRQRWQAEAIEANTASRKIGNWGLSLDREGEVASAWEFPAAGEYVLRVRACAEQAGPEKARLAFRIGGRTLAEAVVPGDEEHPEVFETSARVEAGTHPVAIAYVNNYVDADNPDPALRGDRNLLLDWFEVEKVAGGGRLSSAIERLFVCTPDAAGKQAAAASADCARRILGPFLRRAFRRAITEDELARHLALVNASLAAGDGFEAAIAVAVQAALVSPQFLFRIEGFASESAPPAAEAASGSAAAPGKVAAVSPVGDFALASRLSYFIWSSMPDEELLAAAAWGRLNDEATLAVQVERLLDDPRSRSLVENFAGQWLGTRQLERAAPDPKTYPDFDAALVRSMERETLLFFDAILRENRSLIEFFDADFTYVDGRLARHYGIAGVEGEDFRRVSTAGTPRGGILAQGSILTLTSNPTRTSPVKRGKWVLEQLFGMPPPPPPPMVEELQETPEAVSSGSLRQRMEQHRRDPNCATCHQRMDPIGFAFENFDGIGAWRERDGQFPIDASGVLPDGRSFDGPAGLKGILRQQKDDFARCLAEKLLTYGLGRGLEFYDRCAVEKIVETVAGNGYKIRSLIREVVTSHPFRNQRGEPGERGGR